MLSRPPLRAIEDCESEYILRPIAPDPRTTRMSSSTSAKHGDYVVSAIIRSYDGPIVRTSTRR